MTTTALDENLPLTNSQLIWRLTFLIAIWMTLFSSLGFIFTDIIYHETDLAETFMTNDLVNIILGLPMLIYVLISLKRKKLLGLLLLPGALIYVFYNYFAYLVGRPGDMFTIFNLGLVLLSIITLIVLLKNIDHQVIKARLAGSVPDKVSGWILLFIGLAFFTLASFQLINSILTDISLTTGEQATSLADLTVSLLWAGGGILLMLKKPLGYTTGLGLLIAASSLFIGLIVFFLLNPIITGKPLILSDLLTIFFMGFICYTPLFFYWRGIIRVENI
jgi:hypothetical protein